MGAGWLYLQSCPGYQGQYSLNLDTEKCCYHLSVYFLVLSSKNLLEFTHWLSTVVEVWKENIAWKAPLFRLPSENAHIAQVVVGSEIRHPKGGD